MDGVVDARELRMRSKPWGTVCAWVFCTTASPWVSVPGACWAMACVIFFFFGAVLAARTGEVRGRDGMGSEPWCSLTV